MEIEANVSEVNIGKVNVGNKVNITFDAFPANIYTGVVTFVEPGETVVDNVVNYKVHISIEGDVTNLKSGLTSNLRILTDSHDNVLTVPAYAILGDDGKDYLMKVVNDRTEKVEVETGILGSNGRIEILRGINEGEIIRVPLAK
jgi:HlyD family secretion protein